MTWLLLALVSFSGVASAQMLDDGENYPPKKGEAIDPLYGNRPALTMSQRQYSERFERPVVQPSLEAGFLTGAIAVNFKNGATVILLKGP